MAVFGAGWREPKTLGEAGPGSFANRCRIDPAAAQVQIGLVHGLGQRRTAVRIQGGDVRDHSRMAVDRPDFAQHHAAL